MRRRLWTVSLLGAAGLVASLAAESKAVGVLQLGDPILAIDADFIGSAYPAAEAPPNLLDGDSATKYLNFRPLNAGFIVTPSVGSRQIQSFQITTANDAAARDPSSWQLFGTNSPIASADNSTGLGEPWTLIGGATLATTPGFTVAGAASNGAILPNARLTKGNIYTVTNANSYSSYKMIFPTIKNAGAGVMQLADIGFFTTPNGRDGSNNLLPSFLTVGDPIKAIAPQVPSSNSPANEQPPLLLDMNSATKYLNFGGQKSGFIITPQAGPTAVNGFQITTANDFDHRDPRSYEIYGTNETITTPNNGIGNEQNWIPVASGTLDDNNVPTARFTQGTQVNFTNSTAYKSYKMVFPTVRDVTQQDIVQLADIQFFAPTAGDLQVTVNRTTGQITLTALNNVNLGGYTLNSATNGLLNPANWTSIADNGDQNSGGTIDPNDVWTKTSSTNQSLAENHTPGSGADNGVALTTGQVINLGTIIRNVPFGNDFSFAFAKPDGSSIGFQTTFVGAAPTVIGDYNNDGVVGPADWPLFRAGLGGNYAGAGLAAAYQGGDLDRDFDSDIQDFFKFEEIYDLANGAGALRVAIAAVPEPTSVAIIGLALAGAWGFRRRSRLLSLLAVIGIGTLATQAHALSYSFNPVPTTVTSPDASEDANSGPEKLFDDPVAAPEDIDVFNYATSMNVAQYAGLGEAPKTVFMQFPSSITSNGIAYAQRSGGDPSADRVGTFEFWFSNSPFGGVLPATPANATIKLRNDDARIGDSIMRYYSLHGNYSGQYAAMRITVADVSFPRDVNNIGGHELRFLQGPSDLVLEVNRANGAVTLKNNGSSAQSIDLQSIEITSAAGSLRNATFTGLGGQAGFPAGNGTGSGWEKGLNLNTTRLVETNLLGSSVFGVGASVSLGNAYNNNQNSQDLAFFYTATNPDPSASGGRFYGTVTYIGVAPGVVGDYNSNGTVDAADYNLWRDNNGTNFALPNRDPANTGNLSVADYNSWRTRFGNTSAVAAAAAVPEPSTLLGAVLLFGSCGLALRTRRG